jgi:hypothetical protein
MLPNTFTNISAGDDSRLLIVSTTGVIIQATDITTGQRTTHGMGQMSDESIQTLIRHDVSSTSEEPQEKEMPHSSWKQYGNGRNINDDIN